MSEISWIKLLVDVFDDEKIKLIEDMPMGDSILVVFFKLLTKAGKSNNYGMVSYSETKGYTPKMFATLFNTTEDIINISFQTLVVFDIITIDENNIININNWERHQNIEGMEQAKALKQLRNKRYTDKKKLLQITKQDDFKTTIRCEKDVLEVEEDKSKNKIRIEDEEENEISTATDFLVYGYYENIYLSNRHLNSLITEIMHKETVYELIEELSQAVSDKKELPFDGVGNHFSRLRAFWKTRQRTGRVFTKTKHEGFI